jgi:hypothetical protein
MVTASVRSISPLASASPRTKDGLEKRGECPVKKRQNSDAKRLKVANELRGRLWGIVKRMAFFLGWRWRV